MRTKFGNFFLQGSCKFDPSQVAATVSSSNPTILLKGIPSTMAALANGNLVYAPLSISPNFYDLV